MASKVVKKESGVEKSQKRDYLWHFVFFILGICAGLLYYRIFLIEYYQ